MATETEAKPERAGAQRSARSIERPLAHIHHHLGERLPLEDLARVAGLSVWRFATVFRRQVGQAPHRYICTARVRRAQDLLDAGMPTASVASETGFYDQSHLSPLQDRVRHDARAVPRAAARCCARRLSKPSNAACGALRPRPEGPGRYAAQAPSQPSGPAPGRRARRCAAPARASSMRHRASCAGSCSRYSARRSSNGAPPGPGPSRCRHRAGRERC